MKLERSDVERIARLARIQLQEEELEALRGDLGAILTFVERLQEEDVEGVPPTHQVTGLQSISREDTIQACDAREAILNQAPRREADTIEVRSVK